RVPAFARGLAGHFRAGGLLCIGHSESFDAHSVGLRLITNSIYSPIDGKDKTPVSAPGPAPIKGAKRALVVDDSGVVRKKLSSILVGAGFEVSEACDGMAADREISKQAYDFITVDLHMPGDDGVTWIRKVRQKGNRTPAVMVSDSTLEDAPQILEVLGKEIHDFFDKKTLHSHPEYLIEKAKALTALVPAPRPVERSKNRKTLPDLGFSQADVILVGASTGGTTALIELLQNIPKPCPPVVVVQHITPNFLKPFAERLARAAGLELGESTAGAHLKSGFLYMAHGDYHVGVGIEKGLLALKTSTEGPISRHRPSVDYLFSTASQIAKHPILGILMTGMGADGASGLLQLKRAGGFTACQSEESCVVFGMPKEAIRMGADRFVGSIEELRSLFIKAGGKSS
ncbi:MAG: chemotaxis protein CheB, partial [Bdellovibrionales bacterium]